MISPRNRGQSPPVQAGSLAGPPGALAAVGALADFPKWVGIGDETLASRSPHRERKSVSSEGSRSARMKVRYPGPRRYRGVMDSLTPPAPDTPDEAWRDPVIEAYM